MSDIFSKLLRREDSSEERPRERKTKGRRKRRWQTRSCQVAHFACQVDHSSHRLFPKQLYITGCCPRLRSACAYAATALLTLLSSKGKTSKAATHPHPDQEHGEEREAGRLAQFCTKWFTARSRQPSKIAIIQDKQHSR